MRSDEPTVALTIGADTRTAAWHSGTSAPPSHTFTYTVQASDFDGDGISIAAGAVTANGGFLTYSGSDDPYRQALVGLGSHAVTDDGDHRVRDTAPVFSAAVPAQHYVAGTAASLTLPAATGDGSISYELTSTLPADLPTAAPPARSAERRRPPAPPASRPGSPPTATADETALTFTITVASATAPKVSALTFLSLAAERRHLRPRRGDRGRPQVRRERHQDRHGRGWRWRSAPAPVTPTTTRRPRRSPGTTTCSATPCRGPTGTPTASASAPAPWSSTAAASRSRTTPASPLPWRSAVMRSPPPAATRWTAAPTQRPRCARSASSPGRSPPAATPPAT